MADAIELPERPASITVEYVSATKAGGYRQASSGRDADTLVFRIRPRLREAVGLLLLALAWHAFMGLFCWVVVSHALWATLLCLAPFIAVGIGLAGAGIVEITSPVSVRVGAGRLYSRQSPLRLRRNIDLDITRMHRVGAVAIIDGDGRATASYRLYAVLDETVPTFASGLTLEEASYLRRAIERHLGIVEPPDAPV